MGNNRSRNNLRKNAPKLIVAAIAIAIVVYVLFEILEDVFIEGAPMTSGPLISAIISLTHNVKDTVQSWGYAGIFVLMLLESSSLPIPSEVVLPFAGYLASSGLLNFWIAVTIATVAGIVGSLVDYYIGLKGVQSLAKHKILGRVLLSQTQLEIAASWFSRHGASMVFLSRLLPGFRTIVSFPAGAVRMKLLKFIAFTAAGCIFWNVILIYVGWYLGNNWDEVAGISRYLILASVVGALVLVAYILIRRKRIKAEAVKHRLM
ncbi:MAG: DedA family protein [Candidatus Bathyarchaeia archaeon]